MPEHRDRRTSKALRVLIASTTLTLIAGVTAVSLVWQPTQPSSPASAAILDDQKQLLARMDALGLRRLVVYGHSMPAGNGASDPSLGYVSLTAEATGMHLVDNSEGRATASVTAESAAVGPGVRRGDVAVIHTGVNDLFRRDENAVVAGREAVRALLTGTAAATRQVVILECQPVSWEDTLAGRELQPALELWNEMLREEAASAGAEALDTCATWDPQVFTDPPQFHPNDDGHALIAEELVATLTES